MVVRGTRWRGALAGPVGRRAWLLEVELAWYAVAMSVIVAGLSTPPPPLLARHVTTVILAGLCALAALARWWTPQRTGGITAAVLGVGLAVLVLSPLGALGPLRLMLAGAVLPVLLAATVRRAPWHTVALVVALAVALATIDVLRNGAALSILLAAELVRSPSLPFFFTLAAFLVVGPVAQGLVLRSADAAAGAERERRRRAEERLLVARDLHDTVANHVTSMIVTTQAAGLDASLPAAVRASLTAVEDAGGDALAAMQRMVRLLRSDRGEAADLESADLPPAATPIDAVLAAVGEAPDVRVSVRNEPAVPGRPAVSPGHARVAPQIATAVHRIVVEALTNARRYRAPGSDVDIVLSAPRPSVLLLEILNDRARTARTVGGGFGLIGLRERAVAVGGSLEAGPVAGDRWSVRLELPR